MTGAAAQAVVHRTSRAGGLACLAGISRWKRARVLAMLGPDLPVADNADAALRIAQDRGGAIGCWLSRAPGGLLDKARDAGVAIWSIEDGFIRSRGLGAGLVQPCSLVIDRLRPHYDPAGPSELEDMLQHGAPDAADIARAKQLIDLIHARGITKYQLGGRPVDLPAGRRVVLVPGQVADDRSVVCGSAGIANMAELLARVRAAEPEAFIVYKPHPDVVTGLRHGAMTAPHADLVAPDADLNALLDRADAVHVLSSQTGFEALLRGRAVVTHGQPFYAGWGLTTDMAPIPRRTRRLSLAELVHAVLIAYPLYADPDTGQPCTVEQLVARLAQDGAVAARATVGGRVAAWGRTLKEKTA